MLIVPGSAPSLGVQKVKLSNLSDLWRGTLQILGYDQFFFTTNEGKKGADDHIWILNGSGAQIAYNFSRSAVNHQ